MLVIWIIKKGLEGSHHFLDERVLDLYYLEDKEENISKKLSLIKRLEVKGLLHNCNMHIEIKSIEQEQNSIGKDIHSEFAYTLSEYGEL